MHGLPSTRRAAARSRRLRGAAPRAWIIAVLVLPLSLAVAWHVLPKFSWSSEETGTVIHQVERREFVHEISGRGNLESANNVEIKCEVKGHGGGTRILWVIPEGTHVEPVPDWEPDPDNPDEDPPDLLVKLNASSLENQKTQQQISCNSRKAEVILAKKDLQTARNVLEEYVEGTYKREKQRIEGDISMAEKELVRAQQHLADSQVLHAKGFISDRELQGREFEMQRKRIDLERAMTAMEVLQKYTKPKFVTSRLSDIAISVARVEAQEQLYRIDMEKLALIEEQIEKCTIRAPAAGQVVYANEAKHWGTAIVIEAGTVVREHQVLLRLPDPATMQIKAKIDEAAVAMVREGMPARIHLDAFENVELTGSVRKVNEYPEPSGWFSAAVKEYETTIEIDELPTDEAGEPLLLRPGMTAEAKIRVQTLPDAIQVPVQAVFEHGGKHYCVQPDGESFRLRRVTLGSTNDETVVILEGPEVDEQVVMGAASYRDELVSPHVRPETPGRPRLHQVERGEFVHEITERGSVESAENVEIECKVQGHGGGTRILWVIPEGTYVEPAPDWEPAPDNPNEDPPDLLVKLDASAWEDVRTQQQTWCKTSEAVMIRSKNELEKAQISLEEYVEGRYEQEKQRIESRILLARQEQSRAQQYLEDSEVLLARGFVAAREVQKDRFAVAKARTDLEAARTALRVLEDYTKPKTETSLQADIETAVAQLDSEDKKHQLNLKRLARMEKQIDRCTIRAPAAGQVVYAHEKNWWGQSIIIEEGTVVRERQTLIRLPDPTTMQIKAKINEAVAAMIQEGMPARIHVDAFKDLELTGSVQKVNEYPEASSLPGTAAKEYEATIAIDELPSDEAGKPLDLRPGMTAEAKVRVQTLPDVIQVPLQAVLEHKGKHYCVQPEGDSFRVRRVTLGSTNDKTGVILEGLEVGEQVVMEAASYRDELDLPQLPPETRSRPSAAPEESPSVAPRASSKSLGAQGKGAPAEPGAPAQPDPTAAPKTADADAT